MRTKEIASLTLRIAVTAGVFVIVLTRVDLAETRDAMLAANLGLISAAIAMMMLQVFIVARRWVEVLHAEESTLPFGAAVKLVFIGHFFNQFLVSAFGGDVVRMWLVRRHGVSITSAVTSVVVDRACALLAVLLFVIVSAPWIRAVLPDALFVTAVLLAIAGLGGAYLVAALGRLQWLSGGHAWTRALGSLPRHLSAVLLRGRYVVAVGTLAGLSHVFSTGAAFMIAVAVGADITFLDLVAVFPWVILATALPISVAGWGVREGAMVWGLSLVGASQAHALALSVLFGFVSLAAALPGIVFWLAPAKPSTSPSEKADA